MRAPSHAYTSPPCYLAPISVTNQVGIVWVEVLLQVPYFFAALAAWRARAPWIRIPTIVYGSHTATTLVPILAHFLADTRLSTTERARLVAIYAPYLLMPLLMLWRACTREHLFPERVRAKKQ